MPKVLKNLVQKMTHKMKLFFLKYPVMIPLLIFARIGRMRFSLVFGAKAYQYIQELAGIFDMPKQEQGVELVTQCSECQSQAGNISTTAPEGGLNTV